MLKSETSWLDEKHPCDRCDTEDNIGFLYPLDDGTSVCECCAIDTGWIKAPQGVISLPPKQNAEPVALDLEEISDLY